MECLVCKKNENIRIIDDYKLEVKEDKKFFREMKIAHCDKCEFSFANPMPKLEILNEFYEKVYRSANRPPYWVPENTKDLDTNPLEDKNLNYLVYLTTFIDFRKIKKIFDFGSGYGNLGYLLKKKFPNLELYCSENDKVSKEILKERGYTNFEDLGLINTKFDLIISLHSLEHLTNLSIFSKFENILNEKGIIFFEVPNCPSEYFEGRPYDSPHLLFFTKKTFEIIAEKNNFQIENFCYSSYSFENDHRFQKESQDLYEKLNNGLFNFYKLKKMIKKITPNFLIKLKNNFTVLKELKNFNRIDWFANNTGNNCYIRGILKKR